MRSFEKRLRAELADAARPQPATDANWSMFQAKLTASGSSDSGGDDATLDEVVGGDPGRGLELNARWALRWRTPLLAAAAVVVITGAAVTLTMLGSDNGNTTATPAAPGQSSGRQTADGLVFAYHPSQDGGEGALLEGTVTDTDGCLAISGGSGEGAVVPSFPVPSTDPASLRIGDRVALAGGFADADVLGNDFVIPDQCREAAGAANGYFIAGELTVLDSVDPDTSGHGAGAATVLVAPTTDVAPTQVEPATIDVDTGSAGTASQGFQMQLMGDDSPLLRVTSDDSDAELGDDLASDGTPLGYLRLAPSLAERPNTLDSGGSYLYGVVGPSVERIAVLATDSAATEPGADELTYRYPSADPLWVITGHGDPTPRDGRGARLIWTDIADGWLAFAVQTPAPSAAMTVLAWNSDRDLLQARQYTPDGTQFVDLPVKDAPTLDVWDPDKPSARFGPDGPNGTDGPFVATYPDIPDQPTHDALFEGPLTVHEGCVVAGTGDDLTTLVFPQSQVEPAESPGILRFQDKNYRDGDEISVGGSMMPTAPDDLPNGCPDQAWSVSPY